MNNPARLNRPSLPFRPLESSPSRSSSPRRRTTRGHDISMGFGKDNGGAIPSNLLQIPNTESNGAYLGGCKLLGIKAHPARFPAKLPEFFIRMLTDPDDLVVDIFAGSNTTGAVAEVEKRRWLAFDESRAYLTASAIRFLPKNVSSEMVAHVYQSIKAGEHVQFPLRGTQLTLV